MTNPKALTSVRTSRQQGTGSRHVVNFELGPNFGHSSTKSLVDTQGSVDCFAIVKYQWSLAAGYIGRNV